MTAPSAPPIVTQILDALATLLSGISQAAGYYTDVHDAGIEPLAFDSNDSYPQIVVHEESATIADTNARAFAEDLVIAVHGFIPFDTGTVIDTGLKLRDDITRCLQNVKSSDLIGANGAQLVNSIGLAGVREVKNSDEHSDFLEVIVRVQCNYRVFYPTN